MCSAFSSTDEKRQFLPLPLHHMHVHPEVEGESPHQHTPNERGEAVTHTEHTDIFTLDLNQNEEGPDLELVSSCVHG